MISSLLLLCLALAAHAMLIDKTVFAYCHGTMLGHPAVISSYALISSYGKSVGNNGAE
jgi:hypothetical protein